jgi:quercetin dioxygenase-like cupin family protein
VDRIVLQRHFVLRKVTFALAGALAILTTLVTAGPGQASSSAHEMLADASAVKWQSSAGMPPGLSRAVISGDPAKSGAEFVIRLKLVDGFRFPPHIHPNDEHITVLSGTFLAGMGTEFNEQALIPLSTGGYMRMPGKSPHFVMAKGETIVQLHGIGPFTTTLVNAAGEPLKQ